MVTQFFWKILHVLFKAAWIVFNKHQDKIKYLLPFFFRKAFLVAKGL